jgi:STE24 endopeptidase
VRFYGKKITPPCLPGNRRRLTNFDLPKKLPFAREFPYLFAMKATGFALLFAALFFSGGVVTAQTNSGLTNRRANISPNDPAAATAAWLASVPADKRAKSDAYFEGGYWILLWEFLLNAAIALFLLASGISAKLRDFAERRTRFKAMQGVLYVIPFLIITTLVSFPLDVYVHYFREHQYGLATQSFFPWLSEQGLTLCISLVGFSFAFIILYAVFRRAPRTWWLWGTGVSILFLILGLLIAPVWIEPLFNTYKPLSDPTISASILAMARANEIPVT